MTNHDGFGDSFMREDRFDGSGKELQAVLYLWSIATSMARQIDKQCAVFSEERFLKPP